MEIRDEIPESVLIERTVFEQFLDYTSRNSRYEWGGLLIGRKIGEMLCAIAIILPPQIKQSNIDCVFKKELFPVLRMALDKIEEKYNDDNFYITSWIHTHPNLGVFLSGTDVSTYTYLSKLNPAISAVVVDPVRYECLAVNSTPGNVSGFKSIDVHLDYFYDHSSADKTLIEQLNVLEENTNSKLGKKLMQLGEDEKVHVFRPKPIKELEQELLAENIDSLLFSVQKLRVKLLRDNSKVQIKAVEEENPRIKEMVEKLVKFRVIRQELLKLEKISFNKKLYEYSIEKLAYMGIDPNQAYLVLKKYAKRLSLTPIINFSIWDNYFKYSGEDGSEKVEWDSIDKIVFEIFSSENFLLILSYKTGIFSQWTRLILFIPKMDEFLVILNKMTKLKQSKKIRKKYIKKLQEIKRKKKAEEKKLKEQKKEEAGEDGQEKSGPAKDEMPEKGGDGQPEAEQEENNTQEDEKNGGANEQSQEKEDENDDGGPREKESTSNSKEKTKEHPGDT